jgi:bisanhydrobacterioruberin hydratase
MKTIISDKKKIYNQPVHVWIIGFLIIFYGVGVAGLSYPDTRDLFISLMPFSLLLGISLMLVNHSKWKRKHIWIFIIIALMGFLIEVAGVVTGDVFGNYTYGWALGITLWGTPPLIGLNWMMLTYCVNIIMGKTSLNKIGQIFFGSLLLVIYDLIMEPVAIQLHMWNWAGGFIPVQNYIAWFIISAVMLTIIHTTSFRNPVAPALFFIQMGFFLLLNIFL